MEANASLTLEQVKQYIDSIDFSNVINKLVTRDGWRKKEADAVC